MDTRANMQPSVCHVGTFFFFKRKVSLMQTSGSAWRMKISRCFARNLTESQEPDEHPEMEML